MFLTASSALQAAASRFATPAKESRDKLVARLRDEQANQAARLETLKQVPGWLPSSCTVERGDFVVSGAEPMYRMGTLVKKLTALYFRLDSKCQLQQTPPLHLQQHSLLQLLLAQQSMQGGLEVWLPRLL